MSSAAPPDDPALQATRLMRVSSFLVPVLVVLAASSAAAQSVTPDCAAKLIKQAGMYSGLQGSYSYTPASAASGWAIPGHKPSKPP
ncbi:hypothetical protein GCM10008957_52130 [Deinococcus ruber]|uniref:SLH domain-containing protein n=1 Tax=Deinococcus ruber TaxID=1848197 RepID=A0A918FG89_9DEIO|nr:hypothetical protein GCM10008957_52130 [Deinococcus ruber]